MTKDQDSLTLSPEEHAVLDVFRTYLMTPGKMLCLNAADRESFEAPLAQLIDNGYLVAAKFEGGYLLTRSGFTAMKRGQSGDSDA